MSREAEKINGSENGLIWTSGYTWNVVWLRLPASLLEPQRPEKWSFADIRSLVSAIEENIGENIANHVVQWTSGGAGEGGPYDDPDVRIHDVWEMIAAGA